MKYDVPFRKGYHPLFTQEVFEIVAISSTKPPIYAIKMNKMRLSAINFTRRSRSKSFNNEVVCNRVGFECIWATISRQFTELFYKFFIRATESGWSSGGCNLISEISYPSKYQNVTEGKFMFFDKKNFQIRQNFPI